MENKDVDVVIVGAGPCGLMLANELGRRDISVRVLDMEASVASAPQANATQARTMEYFRRLGFAQDVRKLGLPGDHPTDIAYFTTYSGHELARHEMPPSNDAAKRVREIEDVWNGPELPHRIPQSLVEQKLLKEALKCPDVRVDFNRRVTGFEQDSDSVVVNVDDLDDGGVFRIQAKYLFAADGPQSVIRKQLGIRYSGGDPATRDFMGGPMLAIYLDAPAFYDVQPNRAWMYWTFNRRRRALLATVDGKGKFALQTQLRPGEDLDSMDEETAGKLFLQAMGCTIPFTVTGTGSWLAGRALVADQFRSGRVFLGGDAVHLFTPTGGMGYNTAIEDAVNIGWKLASVIKGQASETLLDSYQSERLPVAQRNTRFAAAFADSVGLYAPSPAIEDENPAGEAARRRAGAYLLQHAQREFTIPGITLGARYSNSTAIINDDTPLPPDAPTVYVPSAKPGGRLPHVWMEHGSSLFDNLGFEWTLLDFTEESSTADIFQREAERLGIELEVVKLHDHPVAIDLYERKYALIRPDQIVGWRGDEVSEADVKIMFEKILATTEDAT